MRIAVIGSREISGPQMYVAMFLIDLIPYDWFEKEGFGERVIISGGAAGVDTMAKEHWEFRGVHVQEYLPTVFRWHGKGGFMERNLRIAKDCDRMLCIQSAQSKTYGSGWTFDQAVSLGLREGTEAVRVWI